MAPPSATQTVTVEAPLNMTVQSKAAADVVATSRDANLHDVEEEEMECMLHELSRGPNPLTGMIRSLLISAPGAAHLLRCT